MGPHLSLGAPWVSHPKGLTASAVVFPLVQPMEGQCGTKETSGSASDMTRTTAAYELGALDLRLISCPSNADVNVRAASKMPSLQGLPGPGFFYLRYGLRKGLSFTVKMPCLNLGSSLVSKEGLKHAEYLDCLGFEQRLGADAGHWG